MRRRPGHAESSTSGYAPVPVPVWTFRPRHARAPFAPEPPPVTPRHDRRTCFSSARVNRGRRRRRRHHAQGRPPPRPVLQQVPTSETTGFGLVWGHHRQSSVARRYQLISRNARAAHTVVVYKLRRSVYLRQLVAVVTHWLVVVKVTSRGPVRRGSGQSKCVHNARAVPKQRRGTVAL